MVSNRASAAGLQRARAAGVATVVIPHDRFESREAFDGAVVSALREAGAHWVVLAGFMRIVTPLLLSAFPRRVLNMHPALCPAFPGLEAHAQALAYGVRVTGCTVHLVDEGVDTGPIIAQSVVEVRHDDDVATLSGRLLHREHKLLVQVLQWIAEDRLEILEPGVGESGVGTRTKVRLRGVSPLLGVSRDEGADA